MFATALAWRLGATPHPEDSTPEVVTIKSLHELLETLRFLRGENGCPWDRKQTLADMTRYLIDEAYELQDAVSDDDSTAMEEELGDVLFIVLSLALMFEEQERSHLDAVARAARDKIVRRHPHVFADREARSAEEGLRHWREMKESESRAKGEAVPRLLDKIPRSLPAMRRAVTVQRKVAGVGFEWETAEQVYAKFLEEARELREVLSVGDPERTQEELGDMLFSVINLGRFMGVDSEAALHTTVSKFIERFHYVEERLRARRQTLEGATLQEMDKLWEEAKKRD